MKGLGNDVEVKRLIEVYPGATLKKEGKLNPYEFNYINAPQNEFMEAMIDLKRHPDLLDKIFNPNKIIGEGFYALLFGFSGYLENRIPIVIDDFIPIKNGKYLFGTAA